MSKTQLGLYRFMEDGGGVPDIPITDAIKEKIKTAIGKFRLQQELGYSEQGRSEQSANFKLCYNEIYPDIFFVIYEIREFLGQRFISNRFGYLTFDKNGDYFKKNESEFCKEGFLENCYIIDDNFL